MPAPSVTRHACLLVVLATLVFAPIAVAGPLDVLEDVISGDPPERGGAAASQAQAAPEDDPADLSIVKVDSADPVAVGAQFTYNLTVSNAGPDPASSVIVRDQLPSGVTYVSTAGGGFSCSQSGGLVTCTRSSMNSGQSFTIRITVQAATVGNWTNLANITSSTPDPNTANNADSEITTVRTAAPVLTQCFADADGVHLDWSAVAQATGYNIYRATGAGSFVFLATTTATDYLDNTAAVGQAYRYRVTSLSAVGESAPSEECSIASVPELPTILSGALATVGAVGVMLALRRRSHRA